MRYTSAPPLIPPPLAILQAASIEGDSFPFPSLCLCVLCSYGVRDNPNLLAVVGAQGVQQQVSLSLYHHKPSPKESRLDR